MTHAHHATASPADPALASRMAAAAMGALRERRPTEALPMLDRLRLMPGHAGDAEALRAEALLALGRALDADAAAEAALAEAPGDAGRLELRARAHAACGRRIEALDAAAAAVIAARGGSAPAVLLGMLLLDERRFDEAICVLGDAARRHPDDARLQLRLGVAFVRGGRHEAAAEVLDRCLALAPALPGLACARAQAALARGAADEAVAIARLGLERFGPEPMLQNILAHALEGAGRRDEAAAAFRAAARLAPDDPYLAHLSSTASGEATERATAGYVEAVFDGYAPRFEASLIALGYRAPGLVRRVVERHRPEVAAGRARLGPVLDLGCGTGLVGVALHDLLGAAPLVGVDLSRRMLDGAAAKGIYTELRHADIPAALRADAARYTLVSAADVFCYLGRLDEVLGLCRARLEPGGLMVFTVERGAEGEGWRLHDQGRYAHAPDQIRSWLAQAGFGSVELREEPLRMDRGRVVDGLLVTASVAG